MSRQINTPVNQVKLTNVAVVRYNLTGKRFEIACYRNKVMDYRAGLETDLSEVLQTDRIFTNVSKGQFAASTDLMTAFGTTNDEAIVKIILEKGNSLQVSDLERNQLAEQTLAQICTWIASNCVHPETCRPYTVSQIKHSLGKNYTVQPHKAIKKQYLDATKFLKTVIPIERAKMELSVQYLANQGDIVEAALARLPQHRVVSTTQNQEELTTTTLILHVDPAQYRELNELSKSVGGRMEILQQVVAQEGDVDLNLEMQRKKQVALDQQQSVSESSLAAASSLAPTGNNITKQNASDELDPLAEKLAAVRLQAKHNAHDGSDDDNSDDDDDGLAQPATRKNQRKAQKKSKKAKRREKEEAAERQARIDAEKQRQEERFEKTDSANLPATANAATQEQQQEQAAKSCNSCGGSFVNASEYRAHFRSDWHRFNQKLKLQGVPAVSEHEFTLCDADTFFG